ncbi:tetratricopeptide repeat-containing sensor histidine kinase [Maribacter spongiicola]|uniref:tetratricopeptide repeat-containing sensor histidine kinase n=1 Tax=Maribacter spongiicola TaxID=1206753 RepID=UPI001FBA433A|nr:tetratricopeptide repeat protein [Maribacter spongiicola]
MYFLVLSHHSYSQDIPENLKGIVDSLLSKTPKDYQQIQTILAPFSNDSTALRYIEQISTTKKYLPGETYALIKLGNIYRELAIYPKALELYQKALERSTEADNIELRIYALNMLSTVYRRTDAIKSALDYSQEALELAETITEPNIELKKSITISLNSIGGIYQMLEQYDLAIEKYERSMTLQKESEDKQGLAISHQNLGECYEFQGKLEPALKNFRKALVYNEIIDSNRGKIICNYSIAHVYVHMGKVQEAITILENNLLKAISLSDQKIITTIYINLGWALIRLGDYDAAETNLESGLDLATSNEFNSEIAEANKFLSELWIKRDDYQKGMLYFKESRKYEERITNSLNLRYVNDMILRYESQIRANQLERLAEENESVRLKLKNNRTMLLIIGIFLILLVGILYILYRQNQLNAEKKLLTLEQSMLRSQMNPHFLFNSLNSIKLYIINNEKKNAVHYLNKFSKLVRKILEASSQREISLAEELETVALYMNIENIRFSNEINFVIEIKDEIDTHNIKIPSLILQPFLENALWHGLSSKDGAKNIDLVVKKGKSGFIEIIITDNGVGRDAAEKIKDGKFLKRKSVGIDITKERLANFSRDYENFFHVDIIDKFDDDTNAIGTQIVIYIPTI